MFSFWKKKQHEAWSLEKAPKSWEGRPGLYPYLEGLLAKNFPDVGYAAFGHHTRHAEGADQVGEIYRALTEVLRDSSEAKVEAFYALLLKHPALDYIDPLVTEMVEKQDLPVDRLLSLSEWLARNAPDREPIKFGIAMLGTYPTDHFKPLFMTLGKHEEFTLFVAVAVSNSLSEPESALFELAQGVHGWGRVQAVERLAKTENPEIKRWMLRKGFRNSVMDEYLACLCATSGELLTELRAENIDEALLLGAGDLIAALLREGPGEGIDQYPDGAQAVERYLHHLGRKVPDQLGQLLILDSILGFLKSPGNESERRARGWTTELRARLILECEKLISLPHWKDLLTVALDSNDRGAFFVGEAAAKILGVDTWEKCYDQVEKGGNESLWSLMKTPDLLRFERALELAAKMIPLEKVATGPAKELGLGPNWTHHNYLDFVVQELGRFPGKGWPFLQAGLQSPVVRNRNLALRVLSQWKKESWPTDAEPLLAKALTVEPDSDLKGRFQSVLRGESLD